MTHTVSAVPSLAYLVQLNAHPTYQSQPSGVAGTALTPASWTSRQNKNDTCKDSWDLYFPSFYYKLLWNILLGKTLRNSSWCGLKRMGTWPTCSWLSGDQQAPQIHTHHRHPLALSTLKWASAEQEEQRHTDILGSGTQVKRETVTAASCLSDLNSQNGNETQNETAGTKARC